MSVRPASRRSSVRALRALALGLALLAPALAWAGPVEPFPGVRAVEAWPGVAFEMPLWVGNDGSSDTLYVAEQGGKIKRLGKPRGDAAAPAAAPAVFLDISSKVTTKGQGGIGGVAFHPGYAQNHRLFVTYLAPVGSAFKIVLAEYTSQNDVANPASERVLLEIPKTRFIHNGGGILFGPDGKLWMGTGDNGSPAEASTQTSQQPNSLLGKILRIDVDAKGASTPYGIPSDNPFTNAGPTVRGEIWAYGFRNAWRMCFEGQDLYVGSPGAKMYEWVTKVARGANHGWPYWEGFHQYEIPVPPNLANQKMEKPVFEYERAPGEEQTAIIGGCFYHGDRIKPLQGKYLCADYGRGDVYAVDLAGDKSMRVAAKVPNASSIGTDLQNEVYVTSFDGGKVYTLAP